MLFGNAFHIARVIAKRRQSEIATLAGLDASYLAAVENGKRKAPNSKIISNLILLLNGSESQRRRLIELAVIDRMLDAAESQRISPEQGARVEKLLLELASFGEKEWGNVEWVVASIKHNRKQTVEELI